MRRILVDYAPATTRPQRGGGAVRVNLEENAHGLDGRAETLLALGEALERLQVLEERLARTAECRLFGGLTQEETADVLGVGVRTVRRDRIKRVRGCTASWRAVEYRVSQHLKVLSERLKSLDLALPLRRSPERRRPASH